MAKTRAPIGFALIVRDAEKTLPKCLASIRPYVEQIVVGVDELTKDKSAKVARKCGADFVFPVQVSEWHECEQHGRILVQHFGKARNASFAKLDPRLPFFGWIDSDDWLDGGEHLRAVCESIPAGAVGAWLPYRYATINNYAETTTVFDRERILRSAVGWEWRYRVHEVVVPKLPEGQPPRWVQDERCVVVHQEGVHKTEASTERNQRLLEIDLEEGGEDQRTTFYLANGHFAAGRLPEAIDWYEKTTEITNNPWEKWQSYCYLSLAYRRLGDLDGATVAAYAAIDVFPDYKEPYYRLAEIYCACGEFPKVLHWDKVARAKNDPPRFVFRNPMDELYNSRTVLADALANLGHLSEARATLEEAYKHAPSEPIKTAIEKYRGMERDAQTASAFVTLAQALEAEKVLALYADLPSSVKAFGRTRDLVVPLMLAEREQRFAA